MRAKWLGRVATAVGAAAVVGLATASAAWADTPVDINPGNVPTTAAGYANHGCDFGGGPFANRDVWVFVLPGNKATFVSVTAEFGANGTLTIPTDGGAIVTDKGTSKAWIATPAGWTLTDASADVTGTADKFNLTHTCPAGGGGQTSTPTPPASESPSVPGSPSTGASAPGSPSTDATAPGSPSTSASAPGSPSTDTTAPGSPSTDTTVPGSAGGGSGGGLPLTGTAVTSIAVVGGAFVAGGAALLVLRRRRDELTFAAEGDAPSGGADNN